MCNTSIMLKKETRDLLKKKKKQLGLASLDAVIQHLLQEATVEEEANARGRKRQKTSNAVEDEEEELAEKKVPQLLSYDILALEPKALKWFTGLNEGPLNWTMNALRDAVRK